MKTLLHLRQGASRHLEKMRRHLRLAVERLRGRRPGEAPAPGAHRQDRFQRLVEMSPDMVGLHAAGRWLFVNPAGVELLGAGRAEELVGRPVADCLDTTEGGIGADCTCEPPIPDRPAPVLEQRLTRLDGGVLDVQAVCLPTHFEGRPATQVVIRDVTERKRTEAALRESEHRYRSLFEGVPVGIYRIDLEGRFVNVNRALVELLGYPDREQVLGRDAGDLYVDPEDRRAWKALMEYEGEVLDFETRIVRADGTPIWVRSNARALRDADGELAGYEGTVEDVTDRKRAEDALRESDERFRSLVQNASDMISILDAGGTVRYQSPSTIRLLGYEPDERIGSHGFDRIHPEDRPELETLFRRLVDEPGESVRAEYRVRHGDGSWRVLESKVTNLLENPAVRGVVLNSRDVTDRKEAEARLVHDALHDALTGLPNRTLLMDRLEHCLGHTPRRRDYRCAVLFLDLDRFKMVNDSFGHAVGDRLLEQVSERLLGCLRPTDTLARLGGDEFAILLEDVTDAGNAVRVAQRIGQALRKPFELGGREIYSSASIGIALSTLQSSSGEELVRDADTAMYRAKGRGRAGYAVFDAEMHAQVRAQLQLETELQRAVESWQFELFYQPIFVLDSGDLAGFETLLRWRHPERGLVLPGDFIPLAEDNGLMDAIGPRILTEACGRMKGWSRRAARRPLFVTVNLSGRQLADDQLLDQVRAALEESGLERDRLVLEITERALPPGGADLPEALERLRRLGVRLALDDFGSGHSSIGLLHRLPFDQVKIDRHFVDNVGKDPGSDELMEGMLALCQWRRLRTVAEGVETEEQRRQLIALDCTYGQGYLFSDPLDPDGVEELLARAGDV
jgi:diguanylate cyclase (GGDEF)-like protein/PAS domain S-box-containing protein